MSIASCKLASESTANCSVSDVVDLCCLLYAYFSVALDSFNSQDYLGFVQGGRHDLLLTNGVLKGGESYTLQSAALAYLQRSLIKHVIQLLHPDIYLLTA